MRRVLLLIPIFALVLACVPPGDSDRQQPDEITVPTRWAEHYAAGVPQLLAATDAVIVGSISAELPQTWDDRAGATPPAPSVAPPMPVSHFSIEVEEVISGDVGAGEIVIDQPGGLVRTSGGQARITLDHDSRLVTGGRYVFFVKAKPGGGYSSPPFGRFQVIDGALTAEEGWARTGVAGALSGLSAPEAAEEVRSVGR